MVNTPRLAFLSHSSRRRCISGSSGDIILKALLFLFYLFVANKKVSKFKKEKKNFKNISKKKKCLKFHNKKSEKIWKNCEKFSEKKKKRRICDYIHNLCTILSYKQQREITNCHQIFCNSTNLKNQHAEKNLVA